MGEEDGSGFDMRKGVDDGNEGVELELGIRVEVGSGVDPLGLEECIDDDTSVGSSVGEKVGVVIRSGSLWGDWVGIGKGTAVEEGVSSVGRATPKLSKPAKTDPISAIEIRRTAKRDLLTATIAN